MDNNLNQNPQILIIGASGRVGKEIFKILKNKDSVYDVYGTYYNNKIAGLDHLDITDKSAIEKIFKKIKPSILIHTAGLIYPIQCEENHELAWDVNVNSTKNLVECCKEYNCKLIFISTDYVFDGTDNLYDEYHSTNPLNFYGKTKVESEKIILELNDYLIIRTAWVNDFHENSKCFVMQVINSLKNKKIFNAASDQFGHPTLSINLAEIMSELIDKKSTGIFHVTGSTYISRFDFAKKIAEAFSLDPNLIHEISTTELNQSIRRPLQVKLNLNKIKSQISIKILSLDEQLDIMKNLAN